MKAAAGIDPTPNTPTEAKKALDTHLPFVLRHQRLEDVGWTRPDPLTLLVPLSAARVTGEVDNYLLRLGFGYYPDWPPSAQFVNPETGRYEFPSDLRHLPFIDGNQEIHVHPNYPPVTQLICASVTLEFYLIRHQVNPEHLWDPEKQTFAATINAIKFGLRLPYYKGRQGSSV